MAHADTHYTRPGQRRVGAHLLIRNAAGHVLAIKPRYTSGWRLVGVDALPGEPPHWAARRSGMEEAGRSEQTVGPLLITDYAPIGPESTDIEGIDFVFDGGDLLDEVSITRPSEQPELLGWKFIPPDQLAEYCLPHQCRRIAEALAALADPALRGYRISGRRTP